MRSSGFTLIEFFIVLIILAAITLIPEWYARHQVNDLCNTFQVNQSLEPIQQSTGFVQHGKQFFTCGFYENTQSGAIAAVVGGSFPFGRDFCVVTVNKSELVGKHIVDGDIDYDCDQCKADIRPISEIGDQCNKPPNNVALKP